MKTCLALLLPLMIVSCAQDSTKTQKTSTASAPTGAKIRSMDDWVGEKAKDNGFRQDAKGNLVPKSDKRSPFENQGEASFAKKDFNGRAYKANDYQKKAFWGNKEYDRKSYAGNTDGSRFQQSAAQQGKSAREASNGTNFHSDYKTGTYATDSARESRVAGLKKKSNDLIESRQEVFDQPEVIDWRQERSMSVQDSKGLLRR